MILVIRPNTKEEEICRLSQMLQQRYGVKVQRISGESHVLLALVGNTAAVDMESLGAINTVESVRRISEPYYDAGRAAHPEDTVVSVGNVKIGGGHFAVAAGPCSVENVEQIIAIANRVKASGAGILRGGAFKPRTSPYAFQGLRDEGLRMLIEVKKQVGLPIVSEVMELSQLPLFEDVDMIQVGARNMQNFELLKELGRCEKPILLKRGLANTLSEWLMSAEYILAGGNPNVVLCERGMRTFETATRNTLDLSCVPLLHELSHLPVMVDPSHGTGRAGLVPPMALAATAAGCDGLMIEVHHHPEEAWSDGQQAITPEIFDKTMKKVQAIRTCL